MGKFEEGLVEQSILLGTPLPDRILNKPELPESLQFVLGAFFDLDTERHHGNGLQRIPWSSILRYADFYEMEDSYKEDFFYLIKGLDIHLLNKLDAEQKAKLKQ